MGRSFLQAEWRDLLLVTFRINPDQLRPHLPFGVEPEPFGGDYFISLVGFQFLKTRILGLPAPFHSAFSEVNLRTYVTARVDGQVQSGVVFFRELVSRSLVTLIARWGYGEPYRRVPLSHRQRALAAAEAALSYHWTEGGEACGFQATRSPVALDDSGLEGFLVNHRWGFTARSGTTLAYEVIRPPWRLYRAKDFSWMGSASLTFPPPFRKALSTDPVSLVYAYGSPVSVGFPHQVDR